MKTLETERLILRPFRISDTDDFYEYSVNPEVGPNAGWKPHESKDESLSIIKRFIEADDVWAVELKENGKVIGSVGLHEDSRRRGIAARMLGYVLSRDYWGQGLMPEAVKEVQRFAFEELGLDIMSVNHFSFNERSKRVIEKSGFTYEGTLRRALRLYDGRITDDCCWSMTSEEYYKNKAK